MTTYSGLALVDHVLRLYRLQARIKKTFTYYQFSWDYHIGDILLYIFLPRVLMLIYIVDNLGTSSPWFWIHLVVAIAVWGKSSNYAYKKKFKK